MTTSLAAATPERWKVSRWKRDGTQTSSMRLHRETHSAGTRSVSNMVRATQYGRASSG